MHSEATQWYPFCFIFIYIEYFLHKSIKKTYVELLIVKPRSVENASMFEHYIPVKKRDYYTIFEASLLYYARSFTLHIHLS